ncbi:YegP family protein [Pseudoxanthomonas sacheonensis]|uniref:YegP family protein n=1 Tax=Pseudoxanthomonas sacheonensis TaxID=443615 RepID=UPI0013D6E04B|nr:DUF1508 domain-containing protein [Pseudoxanthomonas sacheonensis]KAF1710237.1 DUF1508 domain-containing protein [Pseudoxanthomonas sacheonensis]
MYFNLYKDVKGEWRWQLVAANHKDIVADSAEGYKNRADAVNGINLVRATAKTTRVFDRAKNDWAVD